jgi:ribosomal protein S18 acetylase RimI-like enzyme
MTPTEETSIAVRTATDADRVAVRALLSPETSRGRASLTLLRAGQGVLWVAVEGGDGNTGDGNTGDGEKLVGLLLAIVQIDAEREEPVGYIHELLVHPAYRRLGVANHLLDAAERYFLDDQALPGLELVTSFDNDAALHLYRSRGYAISQARLSRRRTDSPPSSREKSDARHA